MIHVLKSPTPLALREEVEERRKGAETERYLVLCLLTPVGSSPQLHVSQVQSPTKEVLELCAENSVIVNPSSLLSLNKFEIEIIFRI